MAMKQLNDGGAVIGYQPKLYYDKDRDSSKNVETQSELSSSPESNVIENHTRCFSGFVNNMPGKVLNNIDFVTNNMKTLINKLAKSFQNGKWNQYGEISSLLSAIENDDTNFIKEFVDFHRDNIKGDIVPELIETIYFTQKRLETIKITLKELYYGNANLTDDECREVDDSYLQKIRQYENAGEFQKINYAVLSYDSTLNRSVSTYAFSANKQCILLSDVVAKTDSTVTNESMVSTVEKLFDEVSYDIKSRNNTYELQQNVEIVQKTLYNYYNKRQELVNLYDLLGDSGSIYLSRKISDYQSVVDEAIINVTRTFVGNQLHLTELEKMESEKHFLLNIYAELNNKS